MIQPADLEWYLLILIQKHDQLADADPEVTISELIGDVETQGSKLPPLQSHPMEQAKAKQQELELRYL